MMNNYISLSKNDFYSFILIAPLFALYQILGFIISYKSPIIIKNSADVYIKDFFQFFSLEYANAVYSLFFLCILTFIFFKNRNLFILSEVRLSFLFTMIIESIIHSISLLAIMSILSKVFLLSIFPINNIIIENIYMSIGAGLWEEMLFRYIMITSLIFSFNKLTYDFSIASYLTIIILSSAIFSYYHFIGLELKFINLSIFFYRFIAGIVLSIIFIFRGLGIAVYTHVFYDLYIVLMEA